MPTCPVPDARRHLNDSGHRAVRYSAVATRGIRRCSSSRGLGLTFAGGRGRRWPLGDRGALVAASLLGSRSHVWGTVPAEQAGTFAATPSGRRCTRARRDAALLHSAAFRFKMINELSHHCGGNVCSFFLYSVLSVCPLRVIWSAGCWG